MSVDPDYRRPYTDEFTGGVDHELFPNLRLSVIGTHRVEKDFTATSNPAMPYDTFLTTRTETGRDGVAGTADDGTFQFYNRNSSAVNQTFFTNDPTLPPDLQRHRDHRHQAHVEPVADADGLYLQPDAPGRAQRQHQPEQPDQTGRGR